MTTAAEFQTKVAKFETNMDRLDGIVNGNASAVVAVDSGSVPSFLNLQTQAAVAVAGATTARNEAVSAATSMTSLLLFPVGHSATLDKIITVTLSGADQTKFYYLKQMYYHDFGTRFRITITQVDDLAGTNPIDVCDLFEDPRTDSGRKVVAVPTTGASGTAISASVVLDFGNGTTSFAFYSGNLGASGLPARALLPSVDVTAQIDAYLAIENTRNRGVWIPQVRNPLLRDMVLEIGIEGGEETTPANGTRYIFSHFETSYFPNIYGAGLHLWRWRFRIRDIITGYDVAEYGDSATTNPVGTAQLPEWVFFGDSGSALSSMTGYTGIMAAARIDWSKAVWSAGSSFDWTLPAQSGIDNRNIYTNDEMDSFIYQRNPRKRITVGVAGDFTTVTAAAASLYLPGLVLNNQSTALPWGMQCSFIHQVLIEVIDDNHTEDLNEVLMQPYLIIRGKGMGNTVFFHTDDPVGDERLLEYRLSGALEKCTLFQGGIGYVLHSDDFNGRGRVATIGPAIQRHRIRKVCSEVEFIGGPLQASPMWGGGISSWEHQLFDGCIFRKQSVGGGYAIMDHNCPGATRGATVHLRNCLMDDFGNNGFAGLSGFFQLSKNVCIVEGGDVKRVAGYCSMADNYADMPQKARDRVAWDFLGDAVANIDDSNMLVLKVAAGTVLGGSRATAMFGAGYDLKHGFGENLILEANPVRKLGAVIGNCLTVNQTIALNGTSYTLNKNYPTMTEAAILAELNGVFGAGAFTVVRLDRHLVPNNAEQRMGKYGASIAAHRFVNFGSDALTISVTSNRPDGFTMFAGATDVSDVVITDRRFSSTLIPELDAYNGAFKLVAGVATPVSDGDPLAVGEVQRGVVTLYD